MRVVGIASVAAIGLTLGYAVLVAPVFEPYLDDQVSYMRLAYGFVTRGEYTRASVDEPFVPEPLRPPGYPLFLTPLCLLGCSHWAIAIAQAFLYGALVLLAYGIARAMLSPRAAQVAVAGVAAYLPIAYFAAIPYSDFLATLLLAAGLAAFVRARSASSIGWALAAGALLGWLALTRAVFVLFPAALAPVIVVVDGRGAFARRSLVPMLAAAAVFVLVLAPLLLYSARYFDRPFASSSGSAVWLGAVQGMTAVELDPFEVAELAVVKSEVAAFDRISDRLEQAYAWIELNRSLGEHGARVIAHDPLGYLARTPLRAVVLWAGDLPVPVEAAKTADPLVRIFAGAIQMTLFLFAVLGAAALARRREVAALLPLVVIVYLSVVALPLGTEARYALPAKPFVIMAAIAGVQWVARRRTAMGSLHP